MALWRSIVVEGVRVDPDVGNRSENFPVLQIIEDTRFSLTAVRGDRKNIYTTSVDGNLRVCRTPPFRSESRVDSTHPICAKRPD